MTTLPTDLRNRLKDVVEKARDAAEAGGRSVLEALAVHHHEPYTHMSPEQRQLRNHLRARGRNLGDRRDPSSGAQAIDHLVLECAYEHWHRMLFARFLAENNLLIEPETGVAITLEECEELAREQGVDLWTLAGRYAQKMLPQIFRADDPLLKVTFAVEDKKALEDLLESLPGKVFTASDSLGWVYQFWQSKRKKQVNESGVKIGADELPAVTQLFTEPYMVSFLLDNSLGAWRAGWILDAMSDEALAKADEAGLRKACSLPGVPLDYLRFVKDEDGKWTPAAGTFDTWPANLGDLKVMDPCCGSGHFLVAAFLMLVPLRMELEGFTAREAVDAVLLDNLHGLEIDKRCVELAAFALALTAWKYPEAGGYRTLAEINVACSGLSINAKKEEWILQAGDNTNLRLALDWLHDNFKDAPVLGSLLNPAKTEAAKLVQWEELSISLGQALKQDQIEEKQEIAVIAHGLAKAATLLASQYHLVITNVPYLARIKQGERLMSFCGQKYPASKSDIATVFLERCLDLCFANGTVSLVVPQNWLFLVSYKKFREKLLKSEIWNLVARLGSGAFETISGEVVKAILIILNRRKDTGATNGLFRRTEDEGVAYGMDVSEIKTSKEKAFRLKDVGLKRFYQEEQLKNQDSIIKFDENIDLKYLHEYADSYEGLSSGDLYQFIRNFWEITKITNAGWAPLIGSVNKTVHFGGRDQLLLWENGDGKFASFPGSYLKGAKVWGKLGLRITLMKNKEVTFTCGELFDKNAGSVIPKEVEDLPAIYEFCTSKSYADLVGAANPGLYVPVKTLLKVPFDRDHWKRIAKDKYPNGLPKPYSDDPTQWIFHGHPCGSVIWDEQSKRTTHGALRTDDTVLHAAVARLLGYRWPAELDPEMELSEESRELVKKCDELLPFADDDGIVCIPAIRGEQPAAERLRALLAAAYGSAWSPVKEKQLIQATGSSAVHLEDWLRNDFFEQHCKLFHHRPFIWHIWDGRKLDGFHALVNYLKLAEGSGKGAQLLNTLTYSYLGDWISRQKSQIREGMGGAEDRLAAAQELQNHLKSIIEGEAPFDIFVRWKAIEEQPIGWEPDINDGVRLNIRPFMTGEIRGGKKGAGILRSKPNGIKWTKDRGKDVESAPWFKVFNGDRINDHHMTLDEKKQARKVKGK